MVQAVIFIAAMFSYVCNLQAPLPIDTPKMIGFFGVNGNASKDMVYRTSTIKFSPVNKWIYVGGTDGIVRILDPQNRKYIGYVCQARASISAMAISHDGKLIAILCVGGAVEVYDLHTCKLKWSFDQTHKGLSAQAVVFSPKASNLLLLEVVDTTTTKKFSWTTLWDLRTKQLVQYFPGRLAVFSPCGQYVARVLPTNRVAISKALPEIDVQPFFSELDFMHSGSFETSPTGDISSISFANGGDSILITRSNCPEIYDWPWKEGQDRDSRLVKAVNVGKAFVITTAFAASKKGGNYAVCVDESGVASIVSLCSAKVTPLPGCSSMFPWDISQNRKQIAVALENDEFKVLPLDR